MRAADAGLRAGKRGKAAASAASVPLAVTGCWAEGSFTQKAMQNSPKKSHKCGWLKSSVIYEKQY